jgi:tetratricopeptide (TPR) repeat protein
MAEIEPYQPGLVRNRGLLEQLKEFQKNPRSLVFVALADSYRKEGLAHQALEILEEGLTIHPGLASAVLAKARCLFELRRYAEALAETQSAVRSNPQNLKAFKLQAEIYARLGQRKAAIRALTHVVNLYPQDVEAVRALEELENLEHKTKVPPQLISRASVDTAPAGRIEDFSVGSISHSLAAIGAISVVEEASALAEEPEESFPVQRQEASPENYPEEVEADLEPTFATRTIAELYLRQGLKPKAIKVLRKILRDDPANSWARETLQDLESDGIVLPAKPQPQPQRRSQPLQKRAKALEVLLARVRLMKRMGA